MFRGFIRTRPQISIFHLKSSPQSQKALELLRSSLSSPYPPGEKGAHPLEFDLEVVDGRPPNADQMATIMSYVPSSPSVASTFLSAHPSVPDQADSPQSADAVAKLVSKTPSAGRWPIVVDWMAGRASIGDLDGVKRILDAIKKDPSQS